jgi:PTS system nitrogen regulatory IIA component
VKIGDILDRRHVIPGLRMHDKQALIAELAQRAAVALKCDEPALREALAARERLGSTGVGQGIAIPHTRVGGLARTFGLFARVEPAVAFDAIDRAPVDLVFLLLTPADGGSGHLSALAAVSRRLRTAGVAAALRAAGNAREIFAVLTGE